LPYFQPLAAGSPSSLAPSGLSSIPPSMIQLVAQPTPMPASVDLPPSFMSNPSAAGLQAAAECLVRFYTQILQGFCSFGI